MDRTARRDFWLSHVSTWRGSGLSQSAYCRKHNLALGAFNHWKCRADRHTKAAEVGATPALVAVNLPPRSGGGQMRLRWEGGPSVELGIAFSQSALSEVIRAVRHANDSC